MQNIARCVLLSLFFFHNAFAEAPLLTRITIAEYGEYPLYASLYVSTEAGFFKEEGLEVNIIPAGGDEKVFAALISGNAQFGVSDPIFTAIAGEKGKPGKVIAGLLHGIPAWGITFKNEIPEIVKAEMLKPYTVGTFPAPSTSYSLQKSMFLKGGLKENIQQIQYGALLAALKAEKIDIALENEPNVSLAEAQGAKILYSISKEIPEFAFTGLMSLPEYIESNKEIVSKVVRAFSKGNTFLFTNEAESIAILHNRFPTLSKEVLTKALRRVTSQNIIKSDLTLTEHAWNKAVEMRKELGDLKTNPAYKMYVDNSFLDQHLEKK